METTAFDTRSSLNPKGGLTLLSKDPAKLSMQAVQPGRDSLFAGMLGQKISQTTLSESTSDPKTTAPGGKSPLPAATTVNGDGEPAAGGKAKRTAGHHPLSLTGNNEPQNESADENTEALSASASVSEKDKSTDEEVLKLIRFQQVMASSLREDAPLPLAGPAGKKSLSLTEKAEPTEDAKTSIPLVKDMMEQAIAIPGTGESAPPADPSPMENATRQIAPPYEPDAALFAQTVKPQEVAPTSHEVRPLSDRHADHRSPLERAERPTEPAFMQRADETLKLKNDGPATDGALSDVRQTSPSHHDHWKRAGESKEGAWIATAPQKPISAEGAERQTEPAFMSRVDETLKLKNNAQATDGAPAKNPAATADPTSQEVRPLSDRHSDHRSPLERAERQTEAAFMQRVDETLKLKNNAQATDGALSNVRQTSPSHHDHWKRAEESKAGIAAASQKPISAVSDGDTAPEGMTPGGSQDKTINIIDAGTETSGPAHDYQQSRSTTPNHQISLHERDMFPFRMEMPNVVSPQGTHTPATVGSTGIDMQAVIDRILETRQGQSNDFGRVRIMLNPPNLGAVDLDIIVRGERVGVVMTAENATVQQALQSRADDIRIALQRQNLKIEGFQVLLQDNGASQQQTNSGEMYRQNREHMERFNTNDDAPPAFPASSSIAGAKSAAGLISIFA